MTINEEIVATALKTVIDPHTHISVYDMGLIKDLKVEGNDVSLTFIPTSPFCPMGIQLAKAIKAAVKSVEGIGEVTVTIQGHMSAGEINKMLKEC